MQSSFQINDKNQQLSQIAICRHYKKILKMKYVIKKLKK